LYTNLEILELFPESNIIINKYILHNNNFIDKFNNKIDITSIEYAVNTKLKELNYNTTIIQQSEQVCLPITITENNNSPENKIDELLKKKQLIKKKLKEKEKFLNQNEEQIINNKLTVEEQKRRTKMYKEKLEEFYNIFKSDKKIYYMYKNALLNKDQTKKKFTVNDISSLFIDKYNIFKQLDEDNILNSNIDIVDELEIDKYKELSDNAEKKVIPTAYTKLFQDDIFLRRKINRLRATLYS
jgi:hypothetical protein